jgi:hypothetical protein
VAGALSGLAVPGRQAASVFNVGPYKSLNYCVQGCEIRPETACM